MRCLTVAALFLTLTTTVRAEDRPLAEKYLHAGDLSNGELELQEALVKSPRDDQIRFGLGVVQFMRAVERLGQSLHEYGTKSESSRAPFLRLPVPPNPDPAPIDYIAFRRLLDDFVRGMAVAERTLAGITDDEVKLTLRLAEIRLDLNADGEPTDKLIDILKKIMRQDFAFLKRNPEFRVTLDRGDVAWLRAYCHLLSGMLDFYLAFDSEQWFDLVAKDVFAKPKGGFDGTDEERRKKRREASRVAVVREPRRLKRFRHHLIAVVKLNRETWRHIRAERDDDFEWLPNPKQKGVLGLPVRDNMIDAWLAMMGELEALLEGKRTFLKVWLNKGGKGLDLKALLDDPPSEFKTDGGFPLNLPDKYFSDAKDIDLNTLFRVAQMFENTTAVGYAAWFN